MNTNTGVGSPASEINFQSALPALLPLLQTVLGASKTGTTRGTETTTTSANVDPLLQLLTQLQGQPAGLESVVAQMFAQGAAKVPELTAQMANATGTRVNNNSMLALSLGQQNTNLAQAIAQYVVQQQTANNQTAANVAGKIADATTTKSTAVDKTANETTAPNLKNNPLLSMGLPASLLAGFLLNKYGKTQTPGSTSSGAPGASEVNSSGGTATGGGTDFGAINELNVAQAPGFTGTFDPTLSAGANPFAGTTIDFSTMQVPNFSGTFDPTLPVPSAPTFSGTFDPTLPVAAAPAVGFSGSFDPTLPAFSSAVDFTDPSFLADADLTDFLGFADGGTIRNRNQVAKEKPSSVTPVLQTFPAAAPAQVAAASVAPASQSADASAEAANAIRNATMAAAVTPGTAMSPVQGMATGEAPSFIDSLAERAPALIGGKLAGTAIAQGLGLAGNGFNFAGFGFDPATIGISFIASQVLSKLFGDSGGPKPQEFYVQSSGPGIHLGQDNYLQGVDNFYGEAENYLNNSGIYDLTKLQGLAGHRPIYTDPANTFGRLFMDAEAARDPTKSFDNAWFSSFSDRLNQATGTGAYTPAPAAPVDQSFADGGHIKQGSGPSVDDVSIKAARGEFMLPADVVDYIGVNVLENLVATLHTPTAGGTR